MRSRAEAILKVLLAAPAQPPTAVATLYGMRALVRVVTGHGLQVAPLTPDQSIYIAAYMGELLGYLRPAEPGRVIGGWSATSLAGHKLPGPYLLPRLAAGALRRLAQNHSDQR